MGDWLHDILQAAAAAERESPTGLWRLEAALRKELGGQRHYVAKVPKTDSGSPGSPQRVSTDAGGTSIPT
jgi:hypothetical protein